MAGSVQVDDFARRRLPPADAWPRISVEPRYADGRPLNCAFELLDRHVVGGCGGRAAIMSDRETWTYAELQSRADRIAQVLVRDFDVVPGNRVLLRGANARMLAAAWFAVQKCGAIAVTTMPLLRSTELSQILEIARPSVAICDAAIATDLYDAIGAMDGMCGVLPYEDGGGELAERMSNYDAPFDNCRTASDDVSLIGFTSGTTGRPKATVHFHRDVMSICRVVADHIVAPAPGDRFIGTAPLAFTFGLGGLLLFPLYGGVATVMNPRYTPETFLDAVARHRATVCFTVPSFYRRLAPLTTGRDVSSLRLCVSSGEALPLPVRRQWHDATGIALTELLGSTEMLHAFVGATGDAVRPGLIGRALPGYRVAILDAEGGEITDGSVGLLAVKGPTGCRYLDDPRQADYVRGGWNVTGDTCSIETGGYLRYHARADDLIVSSGYNICGVEVENVLMEHPLVMECAVVGMPDEERGQTVTAYVVARPSTDDEASIAEALKNHVRERLAPYKYPRIIRLLPALPRNESGKLQRFKLREPPTSEPHTSPI